MLPEKPAPLQFDRSGRVSGSSQHVKNSDTSALQLLEEPVPFNKLPSGGRLGGCKGFRHPTRLCRCRCRRRLVGTPGLVVVQHVKNSDTYTAEPEAIAGDG